MPDFKKLTNVLKELTNETMEEINEELKNAFKVKVLIKSVDGTPIDAPVYATEGSSGVDLKSSIDYSLIPGIPAAIPTNLSVEIPYGYELQIRPRSGLALKCSISVLNGPGTCDSDYRGEIKVILFNHGTTTYEIRKGDKIAQAVLAKVEKIDFQIVSSLSDTKRGTGGFNSTGK